MSFSEGILGIIENYKSKYTGSLEEYLIGIELALDDYRYRNATPEIFIEIIEKGFNKSIKVEEWNGEFELVKECDRMQVEEDNEDEIMSAYKCVDAGYYELKVKLVRYIKDLNEYMDLKNNEDDISFWRKIKIKTSTARAWRKDTPFTFLERVALWSKDYVDEDTLDDKEAKELIDYIHKKTFRISDSHEIGEEGWYKFIYLIEKAKKYNKRRGIPKIVLKSIVFMLSAWIILPQALKDELLSTKRSIKYFGITIFIYSLMCIIFSVVTGCGRTKISKKFKFNTFEWIAYIAIIIIGFII